MVRVALEATSREISLRLSLGLHVQSQQFYSLVAADNRLLFVMKFRPPTPHSQHIGPDKCNLHMSKVHLECSGLGYAFSAGSRRLLERTP